MATLEVELLEPDHEPSVWRQALEQNGEGLHHVAFHIEGMEEMIRRGESQGMKLLQRAVGPLGTMPIWTQRNPFMWSSNCWKMASLRCELL